MRVRVCEGLYVDCECVCVSLCQRPRKGRPKGVVLHFHSFINSPFALAVFAGTDRMKGEKKKVLRLMHDN